MSMGVPIPETPPGAVETRTITVDPRPPRVTSIDAARGLVMLAMIFVNDLAGVSDRVSRLDYWR